MKRKKQLLSWILSFLIVFSIMPMMSINAFADTYDVVSEHHKGENVYPGEVIKDSTDYILGMHIMYYNNEADYNDDHMHSPPYDKFAKDFSIDALDASTGYTIASSKEAKLTPPVGYELDNYNIKSIYSSGGYVTEVCLIANWEEMKKITYDTNNITVKDITVGGDSSVIAGQTYVTSGSSVTITIAADTGYKLPDTITVEMGGTALENTAYEYNKAIGEIKVPNIVGDVKITAVGVKIIEPPTPPAPPAPSTPEIIEPILSALEVSNIEKTSATIKSSITQGNEAIINQGIEWKKTDEGTYTKKTGTLENGILTVNLTELTGDANYTVRSYVETGTKTYYGAEKTFRTRENTSSGSNSSSNSSSNLSSASSSNSSSSSSSSSGSSSSSSSSNSSSSKSDILIVEPTEEAIINALKSLDYKKIQTNIDSNPNLLLSKAIIDALTENKDKTLTVVSNNVSTTISINENNEMQFTRNGSKLIGFVSVFNSEYYLDNNGIVQRGWVLFPGYSWYYLNKETGIKGKGWIKDNGNWYYLNQSGLMQTGWINDSGVWYYLDKSGKMLANTTIDGYVLGGSGAWIA